MQRSSDTARLVAEMWACLLWLLVNHGAAVMAALSAGWAEQQAAEYSNWVRPASVLQTATSDRHTAKVGLQTTCTECMPTCSESALVRSSCQVQRLIAPCIQQTQIVPLMRSCSTETTLHLFGPSCAYIVASTQCCTAQFRSLGGCSSTVEAQRMPALTGEGWLVVPCWHLIWAR